MNSGTLHLVRLVWATIGLSQRPLPENTRHSHETDIYASGEIPALSANKKVPHNYAVDGTVTGIGQSVHLEDKKQLNIFCIKVSTELPQTLGNCQTSSPVNIFIITTQTNKLKQIIHKKYFTVYLYIYLIIIKFKN